MLGFTDFYLTGCGLYEGIRNLSNNQDIAKSMLNVREKKVE